MISAINSESAPVMIVLVFIRCRGGSALPIKNTKIRQEDDESKHTNKIEKLEKKEKKQTSK